MKMFLYFRSLLFNKLSKESESPIPDVEVQSIAEVVIPFNNNLTEEDNEFVGYLINVTRDQPTLNVTDNEHNYCTNNLKSLDDVQMVDQEVLVNTLATVIVSRRFINFIKTDADVIAFTNLPTLQQFEKLAALLKEKLIEMNYRVAFKLDIREILLLCLTKL